MSLFSGARLNELCQLLVDDLREIDGQWVIHITTDGSDDKTLKSKNAVRVVPVHPELVRLGVLDRRNEQLVRGETRLFSEIKADTRGNLSGFPSRWYGRYVARIGVKNDKKINFHSYRHSFVDALRRAGYYKEAYQPLIGHAGASVTDRYGALPDGTLQKRVEMVEAVRYPDLDLSALYAASQN
jgi:integrase